MPVVAALHPLNGFALLGVALVLTRAAWATRRVEAGAPSPVPGRALPASSEPG
jgi:hypothetical protein